MWMIKYKPDKKIGSGGFGQVYFAKLKYMTQKQFIKVALKEINIKDLNQADTQKYIKRQYDNLTLINKQNLKNIIKFYLGFYYVDKKSGKRSAYFVLDQCQEYNLHTFMKNPPYITQQIKFQFTKMINKLSFITQLVTAVYYLHKYKMFHRDMKTQNILLKRNNNQLIPILGDFGLSRQLTDFRQSKTKNSGITYGGTLNYMPPQMIERDPDYDQKVDMWGLGLILYQILTYSKKYQRKKMIDFNTIERLSDKKIVEFQKNQVPKKINELEIILKQNQVKYYSFYIELLQNLLKFNKFDRISSQKALKMCYEFKMELLQKGDKKMSDKIDIPLDEIQENENNELIQTAKFKQILVEKKQKQLSHQNYEKQLKKDNSIIYQQKNKSVSSLQSMNTNQQQKSNKKIKNNRIKITKISKSSKQQLQSLPNQSLGEHVNTQQNLMHATLGQNQENSISRILNQENLYLIKQNNDCFLSNKYKLSIILSLYTLSQLKQIKNIAGFQHIKDFLLILVTSQLQSLIYYNQQKDLLKFLKKIKIKQLKQQNILQQIQYLQSQALYKLTQDLYQNQDTKFSQFCKQNIDENKKQKSILTYSINSAKNIVSEIKVCQKLVSFLKLYQKQIQKTEHFLKFYACLLMLSIKDKINEEQLMRFMKLPIQSQNFLKKINELKRLI